MNNLNNFNNIYLNLSQSAYEIRPLNFYQALTDKTLMDEQDSVRRDFSKDYQEDGKNIVGGKNLPNNGILYVHKENVEQYDNVYETATEKNIKTFENDDEGFKSYYLTDTETLNLKTKNVYISVKGSDEPSFLSLNDWLLNDLPFAFRNEYIPQAKLTKMAVKKVLSEMRENAPTSKLNLTGHSLGTIAIIQGVANLSVEELEQIGEIVLFNGPDASKSFKKMNISDEKLKILNKKVTYYVNPFDVVSMLNRDTDTQIGTVKVIVPFNFNTTFDTTNSHDFGEYRIHSDGKILEATEDFFPDYLSAGKKLSKLINKYINIINAQMGVDTSVIIEGGKFLIKEFLNSLSIPTDIKYIYPEFMKEYKAIIDETKQAVIAWGRKNIQSIQEKLLYTNGTDRIKLRSELILTLSHLSRIESDDKVSRVLKQLEEYKQRVKVLTDSAYKEAANVTLYLDLSEFQTIISEFDFERNWNESTEQLNRELLKAYLEKIYKFSDTLFYATEKLEEIDREQGELFA